MDFLSDVGESGASAGIGFRHAAITDGGEQHGEHRDEDGGNDVAVGALANHSVDGHGSSGLDDHNAVEDKIPEAEGPAQLYRRTGRACACRHAAKTP